MTGSAPKPPLVRLVELPLGCVQVVLDRRGLGLGARGGFEARWATAADRSALGEPLGAEAFRALVKGHLQEIYRQLEGSEAPSITLNLASHQLLDDLVGWTRLNARESPLGTAQQG